jgi:hypothetical protein
MTKIEEGKIYKFKVYVYDNGLTFHITDDKIKFAVYTDQVESLPVPEVLGLKKYGLMNLQGKVKEINRCYMLSHSQEYYLIHYIELCNDINLRILND